MTPRYPHAVAYLPDGCPWHSVTVRVRRALRKVRAPAPELDAFTRALMERPFDEAHEVAAEWVTVTDNPTLDTGRNIE